MSQNLRSESYENGDAIPSGLSGSEWESTSSGAVAVFGEGNSDCYNYSPDGDACDEAWSLSEYGRLYNWHAVDDARGLCPSGWHVPSGDEWTVMTNELGGESTAGIKMKNTYGWNNGGNGTNSSGFSAIPGGYFTQDGTNYDDGGWAGYWWSSSLNDDNIVRSWARYLYNDVQNVVRGSSNQHFGFAVRCIQGSE